MISHKFGVRASSGSSLSMAETFEAKIREILASNLDPVEKLRLIVEEMRLVDKENIREAVMMLTPEEREEFDRRARNGEEVVPGGAGGKSLEAQINRAEGRRRICPLEPRNPKLPTSRDLGASSSSPSSSSCWLSWVFDSERAICLCSLILLVPVLGSRRSEQRWEACRPAQDDRVFESGSCREAQAVTGRDATYRQRECPFGSVFVHTRRERGA